MDIRLFDRQPASVSLWTEVLSDSQILTFSSFGDNEIRTSREGEIWIVDESAMRDQWVSQLAQTVTLRPRQPIIVIGETLSIRDAVRLLHAGIADILEKPLVRVEMFTAIRRVEQRLRDAGTREREIQELRRLFEQLTKRERDVLQHVLEGTSNRKAAELLQVSVRTIESRRAKLYKKLEATNVAQVIRKVDRLDWLTHDPTAEVPRLHLTPGPNLHSSVA